MRYANPIYDSVFKHLMQNLPIAHGMLERLLDVRISDLVVRQQEYSALSPGIVDNADADAPREVTLHIYRMDFCATIELADGTKRRVIIELQKSQLLSDVVRFRRYLGQAYAYEAQSHEAELEKMKAANRARPPGAAEEPPPPPPAALPVIPVFLLDFVIGDDLPRVVRVTRQHLDGVTGAPAGATGRNPFIESLTHDAVIVQFPRPARLLGEGESETELESLLHVFDREYRMSSEQRWYINGQALRGLATHDPLVSAILQQLAQAASDEETLRNMTAEDDLLRLLEEKDAARRYAEAQNARYRTEIEEERRQKEEERRQKEEALRQQEEERRQKDEERRQKEAARQEIEELKAQLARLQARTDPD